MNSTVSLQIVFQVFRECDPSRGEYPHEGKAWYDCFAQDYDEATRAHWLKTAAARPDYYRVLERRTVETIIEPPSGTP